MTKPLSTAEALDVIRSGKVGHLGCVANGEPYVVPINYIFDDGCVYSHSLPGLKIDAMRAQPRACLQVEEIESNFSWRSALLYGDFEEIHEPGERRAILRKLLTHFPLLTPVESIMAQDAGAPDSVVFRLRINRITGMAEGETDLLVNP